MAQINMNDRQSFLINDIKNHVRQGGNVTHILNVKVSNQRNADEGNRIRQRIYQYIANTAHALNILGMNFAITWRTSASYTSTNYHCDVGGMLGDLAVKEHTKALLRNVLNALDHEFGQVFSLAITGVAFLVRKPLVREVVLVDEDIPFALAPAAHESDVELDDAEENRSPHFRPVSTHDSGAEMFQKATPAHFCEAEYFS
jgi:hypothetical protein